MPQRKRRIPKIKTLRSAGSDSWGDEIIESRRSYLAVIDFAERLAAESVASGVVAENGS
jgi:hypothetical protein